MRPWYQAWLFMFAPLSFSSSSSSFLSFSDGGSNQNFSLQNLKGITGGGSDARLQRRHKKKDWRWAVRASFKIKLRLCLLHFCFYWTELKERERGRMDIFGIPTLASMLEAPGAWNKTQNVRVLASSPRQRHQEMGSSLSTFCPQCLYTNTTTKRSYCISRGWLRMGWERLPRHLPPPQLWQSGSTGLWIKRPGVGPGPLQNKTGACDGKII